MPEQIGDVRMSKNGVLFGGGPRGKSEVRASLSSNLVYILALEYGHSTQAPVGMVRVNRARIRSIARGELRHAIATNDDPQEAILQAVVGTVLGAEAIIVEDTPVDTGTAKNSWTTRMPKEAGGSL